MIRKAGFRAIVLVVRGLASLGSGKICYACGNRVGRFLPYRGAWALPPLMKALGVIGSDVKHFSCPRCSAHDRERHLLMYFDYAEVWPRIADGSVLHFAPERKLSERIVSAGPQRYVKADLCPATADVKREDITKLSFEGRSFDLVIANHVLEHVTDDQSAMREIMRVLKPGGLAVLQTPYSDKLTRTFEDPGVCDDEARLQAFGQEDHLRLYGKDLFSKLEKVGFIANVLTHDGALAKYDPVVYGVNRREPFICMSRPPET